MEYVHGTSCVFVLQNNNNNNHILYNICVYIIYNLVSNQDFFPNCTWLFMQKGEKETNKIEKPQNEQKVWVKNMLS